MERYDPARNVWELLTHSLPTQIGYHAMVSVSSNRGGKLYLLGGWNEAEQKNLQTLYEITLPPGSGLNYTIQELNSLLDERTRMTAVVTHNNRYIWLVGGWRVSWGTAYQLSQLEQYDIQTDTWKTVDILIPAKISDLIRVDFCSVVFPQNNTLLVVGGRYEGYSTKSTFRIDLDLPHDQLMWQKDKYLTDARYEHTCALLTW